MRYLYLEFSSRHGSRSNFDWLYAQLIAALGEFFALMNLMGAELFEMPWTQAIVQFFSQFAWALYVVGLAVAVFEYAIESQQGRGNLQGLMLNAIKGFMAVSLFSIVSVRLYTLCVSLQSSKSRDLAGLLGGGDSSISGMTQIVMSSFSGYGTLAAIFLAILLGYAVFKVFFSNLKRGGILLIQIAVGNLYFFGVPRGYLDAFWGWSKQIIGLCFSAFLQSNILTAGLLVWNQNMLLGIGLILAAAEIPRIAGAFGLETGTRPNVMSAVYAAQTIINTVGAPFTRKHLFLCQPGAFQK